MAESLEALNVVYNASGATGSRVYRVGSVVAARSLNTTRTAVLFEDGSEVQTDTAQATVGSTFGLVDVGAGAARPQFHGGGAPAGIRRRRQGLRRQVARRPR